MFETWEERPLFIRTYGTTALRIDGRMIDMEVDVSPWLPDFELAGFSDTSALERKYHIICTGKALQRCSLNDEQGKRVN